ncbi:MAG: hypothetical protein JWO70_927 [Betaproteobacteria bacterium]|jgi:hypothetical protein|nr:hypothetical protein [Betaproteobacteria bacterium]
MQIPEDLAKQIFIASYAALLRADGLVAANLHAPQLAEGAFHAAEIFEAESARRFALTQTG